jgi:hypothetical protein
MAPAPRQRVPTARRVTDTTALRRLAASYRELLNQQRPSTFVFQFPRFFEDRFPPSLIVQLEITFINKSDARSIKIGRESTLMKVYYKWFDLYTALFLEDRRTGSEGCAA